MNGADRQAVLIVEFVRKQGLAFVRDARQAEAAFVIEGIGQRNRLHFFEIRFHRIFVILQPVEGLFEAAEVGVVSDLDRTDHPNQNSAALFIESDEYFDERFGLVFGLKAAVLYGVFAELTRDHSQGLYGFFAEIVIREELHRKIQNAFHFVPNRSDFHFERGTHLNFIGYGAAPNRPELGAAQ